MPELIKTRTGKKLHLVTGHHVWCGINRKPADGIVTGFVKYSDVCDRCSGSVALNTLNVEDVIFRG
jgi:hypothetical protein